MADAQGAGMRPHRPGRGAVSRRRLLMSGAAAGVVSAAGSAPALATTEPATTDAVARHAPAMARLEADVCIVGAGFAGMSAAWRLHQAGYKVIVLEARDRVGGRSWSIYLPDGTQVDRGGAWFGPGQNQAYALAEEMGRTTYPSWDEGEALVMLDGQPVRANASALVRVNPLDLAEVAIAMTALDEMATQVPLDAPWEASEAAAWDAQTLRGWFDDNIAPGAGRDSIEATLMDMFTSNFAEVSLLGALHLIHSNNGLQDLTGSKGGHQQDRVLGGTQSILNAMHEQLGDAVRLESPVRDITWSADHVRVSGSGMTVSARQAVVAVPQWLSERIWWDPPLPRERAQLIQRVPTGQMYKLHLVYDTAFWREEGLSGKTMDVTSLFPVSIDACGPTASPGILCVLCAGTHAIEFARLSPDARQSAVVDAMVSRFGEPAGKVMEYIEQDWPAENWTRGAMITHYPPGVLTTFGPALRAPVGALHWAGTDNATIMVGCIDGAIRSGERAAEEVMAALSA
jgi:monoamine oxidase